MGQQQDPKQSLGLLTYPVPACGKLTAASALSCFTCLMKSSLSKRTLYTAINYTVTSYSKIWQFETTNILKFLGGSGNWVHLSWDSSLKVSGMDRIRVPARAAIFSRLDWGGSVSQLMHMVVDRVQGLAVDWPETPLP